MDNETKAMQRLFSQIINASMILAGLACAVYCLLAQEVPLVLAFVPIGEMTRENQPMAFWGFIVTCVGLAAVGTVQLVRATAGSKD